MARIRPWRWFGAFLVASGAGLGVLNLYGLTQSLRHPDLRAFDIGAAAEARRVEIGCSQLFADNSFGIRMTRTEALAAYGAA